MASQPLAAAKREPTAERTIPQSLFSSAAVVRTLFTPKIKGRAAPFYFWRKERDSNPRRRRKERDSNPRRLSPQRFSRPPRSTAPPSFRIGRPKRQPFFVVFRRFLARPSAAPLFQSPFSSGARLSEPAPRLRPAVHTPLLSTVCAEEEERQSTRARVRADDVPDVVILDLMPREVGF